MSTSDEKDPLAEVVRRLDELDRGLVALAAAMTTRLTLVEVKNTEARVREGASRDEFFRIMERSREAQAAHTRAQNELTEALRPLHARLQRPRGD